MALLARISDSSFRRIVSGKDRTARARLLRPLLTVASIFYSAAMRARNSAYQRGWLKVCRPAVPVISVGNITTGGTGKTPLVIWLCQYLEQKGRKPAILTRGYKTPHGRLSDEPAMLAKACKNTAVIVDADRAGGAQKAICQQQADVLVLDDGFQHLRLARDLNILTLDATCPFGYGKVLPAGLLREPLCGLARADVIVITRYDQVDAAAAQQVNDVLARYAPTVPVVRAAHRHTCAVTVGNIALPLNQLIGKRLFVFCGIGNPAAFIDHIRQNGLMVVGTEYFNDHHPYTQDDIKRIAHQARQAGADWIVCTQKDWVKAALLMPEDVGIGFAYLAMELEFIEGRQILQTLIDQTLHKRIDLQAE